MIAILEAWIAAQIAAHRFRYPRSCGDSVCLFNWRASATAVLETQRHLTPPTLAPSAAWVSTVGELSQREEGVSSSFAMIRGFIAGAVLLLGSVSSAAEFTTSMGNPDKKGVAELYAIGVGHGFFWYQVMMVAQSRAGMRGVEMPLICLPENTPFTEKIILDAAKRHHSP